MKTLYVYLDDLRTPPDDGVEWKIFRSVPALMSKLDHLDFDGRTVHLSLDHDLGDEVPTGYDLLNWIERKIAIDGWQPRFTFQIHSANPVGRDNMQRAITSIKRMMEQYNVE